MRKYRATYLTFAVFIVTCAVTFWHIQDMAQHQRMLLILPVLAICFLPLCLYNTGRMAKALCCALTVAAILNFTSAFMGGIQVFAKLPHHRAFSYRHYPLYRSDTKEIASLVDKLNELTCGTEDGIFAAVADFRLNYSYLQMARAPSTFAALRHLSSADIDLRDGFNTAFFDARYCVVLVPVVPQKGQEINNYLATNVLDSSSFIGRHYENIWQVQLQDGDTAKIYKRIDNFTYEDIQQISDYFMALYPKEKAIFADRILSYRP